MGLDIVTSKKNIPINQNIKADNVLLIGSEGEKYGILSIDEALNKAMNSSLDLVQVSSIGDDPVVCKLLDYGKHLFDKKKNNSSSKKINIAEYCPTLYLYERKWEYPSRRNIHLNFLEREPELPTLLSFEVNITWGTYSMIEISKNKKLHLSTRTTMKYMVEDGSIYMNKSDFAIWKEV